MGRVNLEAGHNVDIAGCCSPGIQAQQGHESCHLAPNETKVNGKNNIATYIPCCHSLLSYPTSHGHLLCTQTGRPQADNLLLLSPGKQESDDMTTPLGLCHRSLGQTKGSHVPPERWSICHPLGRLSIATPGSMSHAMTANTESTPRALSHIGNP